MRNFSVVLTFMILTVSGCAQRTVIQDQCFTTRAAFDVGSATTRMMVAEVNACEQTLVKVLKTEERPVGYKDDLERSKSGAFSEALQARGLAVFGELKAEAVAAGATQFAGTATSAFRGAQNASQYLALVKEKTGVSIHVIEQKTEAEIGFLSAISSSDVDPSKTLVWDIGGGSQQFITREDSRFVTSLVELGSVGFKNEVLKMLKPKAPLSASPNPIGVSNFDRVVSLAKAHAMKTTTAEVRDFLKRRQVVGIGGVHAYSLQKRLHRETTYTRNEVAQALRTRVKLTDAEIGGPYAATDVTNMALVLGYMEALGIESVRTVNVSLTSGTVIYPGFWR